MKFTMSIKVIFQQCYSTSALKLKRILHTGHFWLCIYNQCCKKIPREQHRQQREDLSRIKEKLYLLPTWRTWAQYHVCMGSRCAYTSQSAVSESVSMWTVCTEDKKSWTRYRQHRHHEPKRSVIVKFNLYSRENSTVSKPTTNKVSDPVHSYWDLRRYNLIDKTNMIWSSMAVTQPLYELRLAITSTYTNWFW